MIEEQTVPIPFGQGVNTKTDPKQVDPGGLLVLENGIMTNPKQIKKRNGYAQVTNAISPSGTLTAPKMVQDYGDELVCADNGVLYTYSPTINKWIARGNHSNIEVSNTIISADLYDNSSPCGAYSNGYIFYAYLTANAGAQYSVYDSTSHTLLWSGTINSLYNTGTLSLVVLTTGTFGILINRGSGGSSEIKLLIYTVTSSGVTQTLDSTFYNGGLGTATGCDITASSTGATIVYTIPTVNTYIKTINTAGTVVDSATQSLSLTTGSTGICTVVNASDGKNWVYVSETSSAPVYNVFLTVFSSSLAVVTAKTSILPGGTGISGATIDQLVAYESSTTLQNVAYTTPPAAFSTTPLQEIMTTYFITVNSSGTRTQKATVVNCNIYSKIFVVNGRQYLTVVAGPSTFRSLYFIDLSYAISDGAIKMVAKGCYEKAGDDLTPGSPVTVVLASATKVYVPAEYVNFFVYAPSSPQFTFTGVSAVGLDFDSQNTNQSINANNCLVTNGGIVRSYDGRYATELGFNSIPTIKLQTNSTSGGLVPDGTHNYIAVYQWLDNQGNLHQSAPSLALSVTTTGGNTSTVTLRVAGLGLTEKTGVASTLVISVYRNTPATDSIYREITSLLSPVLNSVTTEYKTVVDTFSVANISLDSNPYTYPGGPIIENIAPPPSVHITSHNNRLFLVDSENRNTLWYSKSIQNQVGVSFSDQMIYQVDQKGGDITAIKELDDKLIIFKNDNPFFISGDGVNDAGTGETFTGSNLIPSDCGCTYSKSTIAFPGGIIFKGSKGIYVLDRSLQVSYIGAPVEYYNSQDITSAVLIYDKSQIRFLTSSGSSLMYDYLMGQWSVFTNHTGYSGVVYNGTYYYAKTDGYIYSESGSTFLDGATSYRLKAQTAWIKFAGIEGFQRIKRIAVLGDYANGSASGHYAQVSAAYDWATSFGSAVTYAPGASSSSGTFQFRERLVQQKCDAVTILLEETGTNGVSGENMSFTDMSFEVGVKKGIRKMQASKTV